VKLIHEHFFPVKTKEKTASATDTANGALKKRGLKKKPASATTTATQYTNDDDDLDSSEELNLPSKRRRIGGTSGPTKRIRPKANTGSNTAATTSRRQFYKTERLMGPLTRPPHDSMPLLPGEIPLGIETFFGEGQITVLPEERTTATTTATEPPTAIAEYAAQPPARYRHAVNRARDGLKKKSLAKGGKSLVLRAVRAVELFERICLGDGVFSDDGKMKITAANRRAACIEYDAVLREIYPELILDAHVLDVKILEDMEGTGTKYFFKIFLPLFHLRLISSK
jgi:hypothetical protein